MACKCLLTQASLRFYQIQFFCASKPDFTCGFLLFCKQQSGYIFSLPYQQLFQHLHSINSLVTQFERNQNTGVSLNCIFAYLLINGKRLKCKKKKLFTSLTITEMLCRKQSILRTETSWSMPKLPCAADLENRSYSVGESKNKKQKTNQKNISKVQNPPKSAFTVKNTTERRGSRTLGTGRASPEWFSTYSSQGFHFCILKLCACKHGPWTSFTMRFRAKLNQAFQRKPSRTPKYFLMFHDPVMLT